MFLSMMGMPKSSLCCLEIYCCVAAVASAMALSSCSFSKYFLGKAAYTKSLRTKLKMCLRKKRYSQALAATILCSLLNCMSELI